MATSIRIRLLYWCLFLMRHGENDATPPLTSHYPSGTWRQRPVPKGRVSLSRQAKAWSLRVYCHVVPKKAESSSTLAKGSAILELHLKSAKNSCYLHNRTVPFFILISITQLDFLTNYNYQSISAKWASQLKSKQHVTLIIELLKHFKV